MASISDALKHWHEGSTSTGCNPQPNGCEMCRDGYKRWRETYREPGLVGVYTTVFLHTRLGDGIVRCEVQVEGEPYKRNAGKGAEEE